MSSFYEPVVTSFIAGLGTAVGGSLIYILDDTPSDSSIAFSLSFAGGVMITVSVIDLFLPIASYSWLSCLFAIFCVSIGWLLSSFASYIKLPEPEDIAISYLYSNTASLSSSSSSNTNNISNGSILPIHSHSHTTNSPHSYFSDNVNSSNTLLSSSPLSSLSSSSTSTISSSSSLNTPNLQNKQQRSKAWRLGLLLCLVLSAHNFPEGILVGIGIEKSVTLGNLLAAAIWLHNVAEGYVVSLPLFAATQNRKFSFFIAALSGLTEPLGAFIGVFILRLILGTTNLSTTSNNTNNNELLINDNDFSSSSSSTSSTSSYISLENILNSILCTVGGVMAQVSFRELLPQASKYGNTVTVSTGFISGVCMIMATTFLLSSSSS